MFYCECEFIRTINIKSIFELNWQLSEMEQDFRIFIEQSNFRILLCFV